MVKSEAKGVDLQFGKLPSFSTVQEKLKTYELQLLSFYLRSTNCKTQTDESPGNTSGKATFPSDSVRICSCCHGFLARESSTSLLTYENAKQNLIDLPIVFSRGVHDYVNEESTY